jgi:hypothetical protein
MKCKTREVTVLLRPDNIVATTINEGITELTLEGVKEVLMATNKVHTATDAPKGALIYAPSFYVKKAVLKGYAANREANLVAAAILTPSFSSQIIGNLLLTLRGRIMALSNEELEPSKVFRDEEKAVEWLLMHLEKAQK